VFYIICNIPVINDSSDLIDLTLPLVGVPEGFLATLSINIFVNIGLIEII
jgi:hypothetical protein